MEPFMSKKDRYLDKLAFVFIVIAHIIVFSFGIFLILLTP